MKVFDMVVTISLCLEVTAEDYEAAEAVLRELDDAELWWVASTIHYGYSGLEHVE